MFVTKTAGKQSESERPITWRPRQNFNSYFILTEVKAFTNILYHNGSHLIC